MSHIDLDCQRHHFSLPDDVHYLNCAYMGPLPKQAEEAGNRGLAIKRIPTQVEPHHFFEGSDHIRSQFARLIGASESNRIAIHPAVSYGVATVAKNLLLKPGDRIVVVEAQFPGTIYTWRRLASDTGALIDTVARPEGAQAGRAWNARILESIGPKTAVVAIPTVHWTDGTRFDLETIASRARDVGAAVIVDATQSCGAVPFDVAAVQPDAFISAAYKWLLGPYSLAFCYLGERFDHGTPLEETWIVRSGSEDFKNLVDYTDTYQPGAIRYDVGERSNFALLPVASAAMELILDWEPARIATYIDTLARPILESAAHLGFGVEEPAFRSPHLFGLKMPEGLDLVDVRNALRQAQVSVSLRGTSLRISPNVYNTPEDCAALVDVLHQVTR